MKFFYLIIFLLLINCKVNNVIESHGISNLKLKINQIKIKETNENDIINLIGSPLIKYSINNKIWAYFEIKKKTNIFGSKKIILNDVLILTFDNYGVLTELKIYDQNQLKKINFDPAETKSKGLNDSFLTTLLTSTKKRLDLRNKSNPSEQ